MIHVTAIYLAVALTMLDPLYLQEKQVEQDFVGYKIADCKLEGQTIFNLGELADTFGMKNGDPYDPKRIKKGMEEIQQLFFNFGYIDFTYTSRININDTEKTAACSLLLLPGKQYFFNHITISGSGITYDKEIRSLLSKLFVEEGKVFSSIVFEAAIHNLKIFLETKNLDLKGYEYKRSSSDGMVDIFIKLQPKAR